MTGKLRWALVLAALAWPAAARAQSQTDPDLAVTSDTGQEQELLPYRGTTIDWQNAVTGASFDGEYESTYNPTYVMSWGFSPRWYLYDTLSARLSFSVELELTDSDWTQSEYEPIVSDLALGLVYRNFYTIPVVELQLSAGLWIGAPTSKLSQAASLYLYLRPTLEIRRSFDVLSGLDLYYSFGYRKNFNKYTSMTSLQENYPCPATLDDRTECYNMGSRNSSMSFVNSFGIDFSPIDEFSISIAVGVINGMLYDVEDSTVSTLGGEYEVESSADNTNWRDSMDYTIELAYSPLDWLSLALGVNTATPQLGEDGSLRAPFINRYSNLYLNLSFDVAGIVQALSPEEEVAASDEAETEMENEADESVDASEGIQESESSEGSVPETSGSVGAIAARW